jgi:protein disulfide-isomerase
VPEVPGVKKLGSVLCVLALLAMSCSKSSTAEETATGGSAAKSGWLTDLAKAQEQAKSGQKLLLMDFTGSDWCGWCKKLDAEVFSQTEFKDYAAKHLVLVEVDFPRGFKLPEATKKQNDALQSKYRIQGFPTIVVVSPAGKTVGELGYMEGGPSAFIKALEHPKK